MRLYWHCASCGDHAELSEEDRDNGYSEGSSEHCLECEDGTTRVMSLSDAAATEQAFAMRAALNGGAK
jgi:hypothetical protein